MWINGIHPVICKKMQKAAMWNHHDLLLGSLAQPLSCRLSSFQEPCCDRGPFSLLYLRGLVSPSQAKLIRRQKRTLMCQPGSTKERSTGDFSNSALILSRSLPVSQIRSLASCKSGQATTCIPGNAKSAVWIVRRNGDARINWIFLDEEKLAASSRACSSPRGVSSGSGKWWFAWLRLWTPCAWRTQWTIGDIARGTARVGFHSVGYKWLGFI